MPRFSNKTLSFPQRGVARRREYRRQVRPYAAPWAVNVRGICPLEQRLRGGSRPGLVKVHANQFDTPITAVLPLTSVDNDGIRNQDLIVIADGSFSILRGESVSMGTARLFTDDGRAVQTADGDQIVFNTTASSVNPGGHSNAFDAVERNGRLFLADATLTEYNPLTGVVAPVEASNGTVPEGCPLITLYRDRIFLAGADHVWYASRQSDPTDWHFGADMDDAGRAVAGQVQFSGRIGDTLQAMIPRGDSALVFAARNEMWLLRGDPADGTLQQLTDGIGVLSPTAWAMAPDGMTAFLSSDGVYLMRAGSAEQPVRWSEERVPDELRNIDPSGKTIVMAYDVRGRGYHLFITPDSGTAQHWWLDVENQAMWPVKVPSGMNPVAAGRLQGSHGLTEVVLGCSDGYLRKFSDTAATDDGTAIESHVLVGPFRIVTDDLMDGILAEIHGILANNTGEVQWRAVMGTNAEEAADKAVNGIKSGSKTDVAAEGTWKELRNAVQRPRCRGPWAVIWLTSKSRWAHEAIAIKINQLGRLRHVS